MEQYSGYIGARAVLAFLAALALLGVRHQRLRFLEPWVHGATAAVAVAAFFNFGPPFHPYCHGFADRWEQFHYQLGSKYFAELGYDGLYVASFFAEVQSSPNALIDYMRDLRTNTVSHPARFLPHANEVRARFSDERWANFVADHEVYRNSLYRPYWRQIRRDHGYNPTPAWTFVAQLFSGWLPVNASSLTFLGSLDVLLLVVMFTVVFHTYGYRVACIAITIAGLGYGWRHMYNGAFLRLDWLAASVIGVCMLKRERFAAAGACLGYASVSRVFPALLLAGPALLAWKGWREGRRPLWALRIGAGFAAVVCLALLAGSATGRGPAAWTEFVENIQLHRNTYATSRWGMATNVLHDPSYLMANLEAPVEIFTHKAAREKLRERRLILVASSGVMLVLFGLASWRASLAESAVLGLAVFFAVTAAGTYYWILAILIPLRRGVAMPIAMLLLAFAGDVITIQYRGEPYDPWRVALLSWGLGALLLGWLLPDAWRTFRDWLPAQRRATA